MVLTNQDPREVELPCSFPSFQKEQSVLFGSAIHAEAVSLTQPFLACIDLILCYAHLKLPRVMAVSPSLRPGKSDLVAPRCQSGFILAALK